VTKDLIEIVHYDKISRTPAAVLATRGWLEDVERGLGEDTINVAWDQQAFVGFAGAAGGGERTAVGVITWAHIEWRRELFVHQSYVLPPWRRRGIYTALWGTVVEKARELKVAKICSITHVDNTAMRAAAQVLGRREEGIVLVFDLEGITAAPAGAEGGPRQ
jgi:GNAT superfamily N-acetyltransferase